MLCRSVLSMPANTPRMLINADVMDADIIIFDLEDGVSYTQKDAARDMLRNFLESGIFQGNCFVRVNGRGSEWFEKDIEAVAPLPITGIMLPKTESAEDIHCCDQLLTAVERKYGLPVGSRQIFPIVETALGVENVGSYIQASERIKMLSAGGEDYAASLGIKRTVKGEELDYARKRLIVACKAYGKKIIDTVFVDTNNLKGLEEEARFVKSLGMDGKFLISPRHVSVINRVFAPSPEEIQYAKRVVAAMRDAEERGVGAVSLDGKMLDKPVLDQANSILAFLKQMNAGG